MVTKVDLLGCFLVTIVFYSLHIFMYFIIYNKISSTANKNNVIICGRCVHMLTAIHLSTHVTKSITVGRVFLTCILG
jgi:hypothetical protein